MKTNSLLLVAAMAGLMTGCATHKKECGQSCKGAPCEKGGCGTKSGCTSKATCKAHGNCSAKSN